MKSGPQLREMYMRVLLRALKGSWGPASASRPVPRRAHGQQVGAEATLAPGRAHAISAQTLSLRAFTGYAFTIFRAGLAFTITILPKTSRLPAFVAGFVRVLILHKPGTVK